MSRSLVVVLFTAATALGMQVSSPPLSSNQASTVTFNKDVLPILQRDCQVCHRPGEVGPMSFLTYEKTRPWAKAIKQAVLSKQMPPWFADPRYGDFRNAPKLTEADVKTLAAWADSGAHEGDAKDKPAPVQWEEGWRIEPDVVVSMPVRHRIPAKGSGEIKSFFIPNPFKQDTWVTSIEIRPGNPSVVHHVIVQIPEEEAAKDFAWGAVNCFGCAPPFSRERSPEPSERVGDRRQGQYPGGRLTTSAPARETGTFTSMEAVYVPGAPPMDFRFHNSAKLIPAGSKIRIEVHYTPNGTATSDQTMIGFTLAKTPAKRRFITMAPTSLVDTRNFRIPAGESDWETRGELTFTQEAELVWFMPHMHLRGKDMTFRLEYPNGRSETVLSAKFNFDWQLGYEVEAPIRVPRGTKMIVVAHHDNSANNPHNPDPKKEVAWGELTSQEMAIPWFGVIVNHDADPANIASYRPGALREDGSWSPLPAASPAAIPGLRLPTPPFSPGVPGRR
jgi:hypothetical protein